MFAVIRYNIHEKFIDLTMFQKIEFFKATLEMQRQITH